MLAYTLRRVLLALPVMLFAILGEKILGPLGKVRSWLERHNAIVMAVVILAIGALLIGKGLSGL